MSSKLLNDLAVRSAAPGIVWDSNLKGFGLRTGKHTKTFIVLVGSGRRKRIGRYPLMTVAQARERAKQVLAQKVLGAIAPKATPFEDVRKQYLEECATRLRPSTFYQYTWLLGRLDFGRKSIGDITGRDMLRVLNMQKPSTKTHLWRVSRSFFTWCFRNHYIDQSPLVRLQAPPLDRVRERVLTDEELAAVYRVARKATTHAHRLAYLMVKTGQRPGEIRRLERAWIQPDRITLPGHIAKNGREHTFPISEDTYDFIENIPKDGSPYLFPPERPYYKRKTINSIDNIQVNRFKEECEIAPFQIRDLRKTLATSWQRLGIRLEVTEAMLNHVSGTRAGIVGVYQRYDYFSEMQDAVRLWEKHLRDLLD